MSIEVGCDSCGHEFSVKDQLQGKRVKCPECGEGVRIPAMDGDPDELPSMPVRASGKAKPGKKPAGKTKAKPKASGVNPLLIGGIAAGGLFVVAGLGVGIWLLSSGGDKPAAAPVAAAPAEVAPPVTTPAAPEPAPATVAVTPDPMPTETPAAPQPEPPPPPPPTPSQELAKLYEQIRSTRAECLAVYEEMMAAPGLAPSKKGSLSDIDQRVWKLTRARLEYEASGKLTQEEIDKVRAEDHEIRTNRLGGNPGDTIDRKLKDTVIKFCKFRPETREQMRFYHEIATAARLQSMQFTGPLPPELAALLPDREVTGLPLELSRAAFLDDLDKRGANYGRDHVLTLVVLFPPTNRAAGLVHNKVLKLIPKITGGPEAITETYVYAATAPQLAVVYRVNGVESRKEFTDMVSVGVPLLTDHERGIYMYEGLYLLTEDQSSGVSLRTLKNPNFVWDGFRPTTQHLNGNPLTDEQIVIRFDFDDDDIEPATQRAGAVELLSKFTKKFPDWKSEFASERGQLLAVVRNAVDFDDLMKEAGRVTKVLAKNPDRKTMVLKANAPKTKKPAEAGKKS